MKDLTGIRQITSGTLIFLMIVYSLSAQRKSRVNILNADELKIDRVHHLRKLRGNVRLKHEDVYMQCDSALVYENSNEVEAYSNVFLNQGDTLFLYGDYLRYNGDTKKAGVTGNVRLQDKQSTLITDRLEFDLQQNLGYYLTGGELKDEKNKIDSREGYYNSKTKDYFYKGDVYVQTPDYKIHADTMKYNAETNIARFYGPTEITGDSMYIYCERGWYNIKDDVSRFSINAFLKTKEHTVKGDTLFYDKKKKYGTGYGHVEMTDTVQKIILSGNRAVYYEEPERTMITDSALFIQIEEEDSLFLHADTLRSFPDSSGKHRILTAFYRVRIYRKDMQGFCDSLSYSFVDSVIRMNGDPVIWSGKNQLTARYMKLYTRNNKMNRIEMYGDAMIISLDDSIHFDQIKGKNMYGYFKDNKLYKIDVIGNGQSIYYPEDQGEIIGFNKAECSNIVIYVEDNKIRKITMLTKPGGTLDPPTSASSNAQRLKGFQWLEALRPQSPLDIFK